MSDLLIPRLSRRHEKRSEDNFNELLQWNIALFHSHPQQCAFPTIQKELSEHRRGQPITRRTCRLRFGNAGFKEITPCSEMHGELAPNWGAVVGNLSTEIPHHAAPRIAVRPITAYSSLEKGSQAVKRWDRVIAEEFTKCGEAAAEIEVDRFFSESFLAL